MSQPIRVTIWNEYLHELKSHEVRSIYPDGIHGQIAAGISELGNFSIRTATLREPEHGLGPKVLDETDVLIWWGHAAHNQVTDEAAKMVQEKVLDGMGFIALHSAHFSKPFKLLMGTSCSLKWREADEKERLWNLQPNHPIMNGVNDYFEIEKTEMYGERFDIPNPDELLMMSWFQGGEVFRSICTWSRGHGRIVYIRPGHETYPIYHQQEILRIVANAATWAQRRVTIHASDAINVEALEVVPAPTKKHII
jgi:trehalose utilization protein